MKNELFWFFGFMCQIAQLFASFFFVCILFCTSIGSEIGEKKNGTGESTKARFAALSSLSSSRNRGGKSIRNRAFFFFLGCRGSRGLSFFFSRLFRSRLSGSRSVVVVVVVAGRRNRRSGGSCSDSTPFSFGSFDFFCRLGRLSQLPDEPGDPEQVDAVFFLRRRSLRAQRLRQVIGREHR